MWHKLEIFYHIVKAGSLVKAAPMLKTDQPTLTRKLKSLERDLGFQLMKRTTPKTPMALSRKGEAVFRAAQAMYVQSEIMKAAVSDEGLSGKIRLSTSHAIANYIVGPLLIEFSQKYKEIEIELICSDTDLDIYRNEVDLMIRPKIGDDENLIQEPLFDLPASIYASPDYLKEFGTPKTPEDLDNHQLLTFARSYANPYADVNWLLKVGRDGKGKRKPFYTANSTYNLMEAAEMGSGLVLFHEVMQKKRTTNLVKVELEGVQCPLYKEHLICPKALEKSERVEVLRNFLKEKISL